MPRPAAFAAGSRAIAWFRATNENRTAGAATATERRAFLALSVTHGRYTVLRWFIKRCATKPRFARYGRTLINARCNDDARCALAQRGRIQRVPLGWFWFINAPRGLLALKRASCAAPFKRGINNGALRGASRTRKNIAFADGAWPFHISAATWTSPRFGYDNARVADMLVWTLAGLYADASLVWRASSTRVLWVPCLYIAYGCSAFR